MLKLLNVVYSFYRFVTNKLYLTYTWLECDAFKWAMKNDRFTLSKWSIITLSK